MHTPSQCERAHHQILLPPARIEAGSFVWAGLLGMILFTVAAGQAFQVPRESASKGSRQVTLSEDHEVSNYLRNAEDGIRREDWKYAIDSLQRIIEHPGDSLVTQDGGVYYSGRLHAQRLLSQLPPEALRVYRLLYGGAANGLYSRGRETWRTAPLEDVVRRYLLTEVGDNAADLLASLYLDTGRAEEAVGILRTLIELHPDRDVPDEIIKSKLAVALALSGAANSAGRILDELKSSLPADRHADMAAFVQSYSKTDPAKNFTKRWAMRGGDARRDGRMDEVEPTFVEAQPLRFDLPYDTKAITWDQALEFMDRYPTLPVYGVVTDGRQLLVRCQNRVVSLDVDSLEPIWMSDPPMKERPPPQTPSVVIRPKRNESPSAIDNPVFLSSLVDQVSGGLCFLGDRVYTLVRDTSWASRGSVNARVGGRQVFIVQGGQVRLPPSPNRLVALYAGLNEQGPRPGSELWSRGGLVMRDPKDPFLGVEFASLPIDVGDSLLVTFRDSTTFYSAVLSPEDGELKKRIPLCDLNDARPFPMQAIHPVLAGRVVYVSSNLGVLFALDAVDWSIRWAARYARVLPRTSGDRAVLTMRHLAGEQWLDSPPLVVGDSVIVAPGDSSSLLAFDRHTGQTQWNLPRENHRYILGRRGGHVLLGGGNVSSVEVSSGTVTWSRNVGSPTGRAVISGRLVYVPTTLGLMSLDVDSGQVAGRFDLPPDGAPFGNLLCWDGAMYSIDTASVRKYHDVQRSYARALSAYEANPTDVLNVIRLGRLELLQEKPKRAIEILDRTDVRAAGVESRRFDQLAHLHVEARLRLAADRDTSPAEALGLVRVALERARSPRDRTRCRLEMIERLTAAGQVSEAVQVYIPLLESPDGDDLVEMSDGWWCRANLMAPKKIETLLAQVKMSERAALETMLRERLQQVVVRRAESDARRIAEGVGKTELGQKAWLALGRWALAREQFAVAEACLRESQRGNANKTLTAEALAVEAQMYSHMEVNLPRQTAATLSKLLREHPEASVRGRGTDPVPVETFVNAHWPEGIVADSEFDPTPRPNVDGPYEEVWRLTLPQSLNWVSGGPRVGTDRFVTFKPPRELKSRSIDTGEATWETDLFVLESTQRMVAFQADGIGLRRSGSNAAIETRSARDGHLLTVLTGEALFGVDLITGKRLWARTFKRKTGDTADSPGTLNVDESRYALLRGSNTVEVGSLLDGRLLWRRQMVGRRLGGIKLSGDFILAVDRDFETLYAYRRHDGTFVSQCRFRQGKRAEQRMSLAVFGNICCGPDEKDVVAYDVATGKVLWRYPIQQDRRIVFRPKEDQLGIGTRFGYVYILDPKTGEVAFSHRVKEASGGIFDGVLEGDRLLVLGLHAVAGIEENCLASVSIADQSVAWVRADLGSGRIGRGRPSFLRMAENVVPMLTQAAARRRQTGQPRRLGTLTLIDKATGRNVVVYPLESREDNDILTDELLLWEDRILVGTRQGVLALGRQTRPSDIQ